MTQRVHVAVAAIRNERGECLLARRPPQVHQGGLWEFPGGKLETDETFAVALARELDEELGIHPEHWEPLIRVHFDYPDRNVLLDVVEVTRFSGQPHGREGQPLRWVPVADIDPLELPAANRPIVQALRLPDRYLVTPEPAQGADFFLAHIEARLARGDIALMQLRAKTVPADRYAGMAREAIAVARRHGCRVLLNADPALAADLGADGVHLSRERLLASRADELPAGLMCAASVHDLEAVAHANRLGVDFMVASPVAATVSHPGVITLGWTGFAALCEAALAPVYALGGMRVHDVTMARRAGGQGIAAIRGLWEMDGTA